MRRETARTEGFPRGWSSFHGRLILAVNGVFLATMAVFLAASYATERERNFAAAFDHLGETLGVLVSPPGRWTERSAMQEIERRLEDRTGVAHRLLLVDPAGRIVGASDDGLTGAPRYPRNLHIVTSRVVESGGRRIPTPGTRRQAAGKGVTCRGKEDPCTRAG